MVTAAGITTMLFYNQVLGVSPELCGIAFLVANIVDAISDPLVGTLSDRFKSRWGRRHPFMLASALPLAVSIYFLYQPIGGLSENGLFIWLMTWFVLVRVTSTFYNVPHDALGAELTDDYHERTSLFGYNHVVLSASALLLSIFVYRVLFATTPEYDPGMLNEGRYPVLAWFAAITVFIAVTVCTLSTRDQIPHLRAVKSKLPSAKEYFRNVLHLVTNRSFLSVCCGWLTITATIGILETVSNYSYFFAYELTVEDLSHTVWAKIPGILAALPLAALLTKRFDKKNAFIFAALISGFLVALPHMLRMVGMFPSNESPYILWALYTPLFLGYMVLPVMYIVVDSQLVDICDDHELRTGEREEGVVFSFRTFSMKTTRGLGAALGAFGLGIINFPKDVRTEPVTPEMVQGLLFMNGPLYFILMVAGAGCMAFYHLNAKRHKEILATLKERRKTQA
jgi:Na+/melibiose symporter-like transporter